MFDIYNDLKFIGYNYYYTNGRHKFDYRYIRRLVWAVIITILAGITGLMKSINEPPIIAGWLIMTGLNFLNGFRPWQFKYKKHDKWPKWINYLVYKTVYGHKMSLQYLLIWDVLGAIIGGLIVIMFF
jgi:hypothetical protein